MPLYGVRFAFRQSFRVPASQAFAWCVDYRSDDLARMGEPGRRTVRRLADGTYLLTDRFRRPDGRRVTKVKLVRIDAERLSWTGTHLEGPTKYSQFVYQIHRTGPKSSQLEYTGLQIENSPRRPSPKALASRSRVLRAEDAAAWRRLARAMASDLRPPERRRPS
jgi:hypothetical protein